MYFETLGELEEKDQEAICRRSIMHILDHIWKRSTRILNDYSQRLENQPNEQSGPDSSSSGCV